MTIVVSCHCCQASLTGRTTEAMLYNGIHKPLGFACDNPF